MIFDALFGGGDQVKPELINISPEAAKKMKRVEDAGDASLESFAEAANKGIEQKIAPQSEKALYGYEPGMSKAIQSRYQGLLGQDIKRIKSQGKIASYADKSRAIDQAQIVRDARERINAENKRRIMQADVANEQARAGAIGSVLGLAGTIVGGAIAGPAGAVGGNIVADSAMNSRGGSGASNIA